MKFDYVKIGERVTFTFDNEPISDASLEMGGFTINKASISVVDKAKLQKIFEIGFIREELGLWIYPDCIKFETVDTSTTTKEMKERSVTLYDIDNIIIANDFFGYTHLHMSFIRGDIEKIINALM